MVIELTKQLLHWNDQIQEKFMQQPKQMDFYKDVQPFVEQIDRVLEQWKPAAQEWINKEQPKDLYSFQIDQVYENVKANSIDCFGTMKPRRFQQRQKAAEYVLQYILTHERI